MIILRKIVISYGATIIGYAWIGAFVHHIIPVISYRQYWWNVRPWYYFPAMFTIVLMMITTFVIIFVIICSEEGNQ